MPAVDSGTVYGDPHIRTLDGRHLSGLEIEFYSEASGLVKKVPNYLYTLLRTSSLHQGGCYWWTDLEDLRDRFSRSLQKSASGEPESKVESGQL